MVCKIIINNYNYFKSDVFPQLSSRQKYCAIIAIALSILLIGYSSVKFVQARIWKTKKLKENNLQRDALLSPVINPSSPENQKCNQLDSIKKNPPKCETELPITSVIENQPISNEKDADYFFQEAEKYRTENPKLAFEYFLKAAKMNHIQAQFEVGMLFKNGKGVIENLKKAIKWLKKAAQAGSFLAQYHLGLYCFYAYNLPKSQKEETGKWLTLAAEANYAPAQHFLAHCYWFGDGGFPEDKTEFFKWLTRAADSDYINALIDLAEYYENEKADVQEAFKLLLRAAHLGSYKGQRAIAHFYEEGKGVNKDLKEAFSWYRKAAESGSELAKNWLNLLMDFD